MGNTIERKRIPFPIEKKVRDLANIPDTFVIALFDTCREKKNIKEINEGKPMTGPTPHRGGGGGSAGNVKDKSDQEIPKLPVKPRNSITVYGCPPNSYTPRDSPFTFEFFEKLREATDKKYKICHISTELLGFKPIRGKGEVFCDTTHDLAFPFDPDAEPNCFEHQEELKAACIDNAEAKAKNKVD